MSMWRCAELVHGGTVAEGAVWGQWARVRVVLALEVEEALLGPAPVVPRPCSKTLPLACRAAHAAFARDGHAVAARIAANPANVDRGRRTIR